MATSLEAMDDDLSRMSWIEMTFVQGVRARRVEEVRVVLSVPRKIH